MNVSRSDNWQNKFTQICQDIRDIKSNKFSRINNNWKMTITPTQLESTRTLGNHKLQDYSKNVGDDQDASCSPYTPSLEMTRGCSSRTRTNCAAPLYDASPTHPQLPSLPPLYPDSPLSGETPLWPTSSTAKSSWKDNITVPKELPSSADTLVNGV